MSESSYTTVSDQHGLEWEPTIWGLVPRWTKEPDTKVISQIARKHLGHDEDVHIDVSFHAQGAFNKLYKITAAGSECLMRVSLPVYPRLKTQSEVATINFVREQTDMPVPRILAFDSESKTELGFEWIMMELAPGTTLRKRWRKMSWEAKQTVVRQLVHYQAQLYEKSFSTIGNLFAPVDDSTSFQLGPLVSHVFFWGDHLTHDVPRGPFKTSHEWLKSWLSFIVTDQQRILDTSDDEDDLEDAGITKELAEDLVQQLPKVFPPEAPSQHNILFHGDLSMQNIMIDETGKLTAIVDWECVSTVPLWRACQFPQLLQGRTRDVKPTRDKYAPESHGDEQGLDALDNEGVNSLYWEHLLEYERSELRKLFKQEMRKLNAKWVTTMKRRTLEADFEKAINDCVCGWRFRSVRRWLDAYKAKRYRKSGG
jgi:Ser/Thr protein kinase RdoA (MazF antagonist)